MNKYIPHLPQLQNWSLTTRFSLVLYPEAEVIEDINIRNAQFSWNLSGAT